MYVLMRGICGNHYPRLVHLIRGPRSNASRCFRYVYHLHKSSTFIQLRDIDVGKRLGSGKFGTVYVARERRSGFIFALKVLHKKQLIKVCIHYSRPISLSVSTEWSTNSDERSRFSPICAIPIFYGSTIISGMTTKCI